MAKTADTNYSHSAGRFDFVLDQRIKYCDSSAEQRSHKIQVKGFRDFDYASVLRPHTLSEAPPKMANDSTLLFCAKVVVTTKH